MRGGPGDSKAVRAGPPEPHLGLPEGEPPPEEREGRGGVDPGPEPVLVCRTGARGEAGVRSYRGPARGGGTRADPSWVREHGNGADGVPGGADGTRRDTGRGTGGDGVLARYDDNRNGRITCKEARRPWDRARPPGRTPRTGTCATGTATVSCANENRKLRQENREWPVDESSGTPYWMAYTPPMSNTRSGRMGGG